MRSKQLSLISKRPRASDFVFFIDRQTEGDGLCGWLIEAGLKIQRHRDIFAPEEEDDVWIAEAAKQGWAIITADKRIAVDHLEVVCVSKAKVIVLTDNTSGYPQWAASIIAFHDSIVRHLLSSQGPLVVRLSKSGITQVRQEQEVERVRRKFETQDIIRTKENR